MADGLPQPLKLEQKLECTFLKPFIQVKTKWASKKFSIYAIQSYQLHSKADSAHQGWIGLTAWLVTLNGIGEKFFWCSSWFYMGKRFQKNALPFLFQFARVRAAHQLHVNFLFSQLWTLVTLKLLMLQQCTLHFRKPPIFFFLEKRGQEHSCMFSL